MNSIPNRPTGDDEEAYFYQWVWDQLVIYGRLIDTPDVKWNHTTKGRYPVIRRQSGGGPSESDSGVWL